MKRVVSGRCNNTGECCDANDPTIQLQPDNTIAEMEANLGVDPGDLLSLFPYCSIDTVTGDLVCS